VNCNDTDLRGDVTEPIVKHPAPMGFGVEGFQDGCQARHAGTRRHSWVEHGELQSHGFYGFHGSLLGIDNSRHRGRTTWGHAWRDHPTRRAQELFVSAPSLRMEPPPPLGAIREIASQIRVIAVHPAALRCRAGTDEALVTRTRRPTTPAPRDIGVRDSIRAAGDGCFPIACTDSTDRSVWRSLLRSPRHHREHCLGHAWRDDLPTRAPKSFSARAWSSETPRSNP
jgi:hypothetical protein